MRLLQIKVKPNARVCSLIQQDDGSWLAQIKAPPIDGKANAELTRLIAAHFGLRTAQVLIKSGASGRTKLVQLDD
jgi:uncharacterized protein